MLIIVRHGESEANSVNAFAGHWNVELTEKGMEQAKKSAEYVFENYKIDKIYSSDLKRAYNTAKVLADMAGLEIIPDETLREVKAGDWESRRFDELVAEYEKDYGVWLHDIGNSRPTNGESVAELSERVVSTFTRLAKENTDKNVYVATHATPIRALMCHVSKKGLGHMKNIPFVTNASLTIVDYENGEIVIKKAGYDEHMGDIISKLPSNV